MPKKNELKEAALAAVSDLFDRCVDLELDVESDLVEEPSEHGFKRFRTTGLRVVVSGRFPAAGPALSDEALRRRARAKADAEMASLMKELNALEARILRGGREL